MAVRSEPGLTVAIPGEITPGTEMQRGFINDNVLHKSRMKAKKHPEKMVQLRDLRKTVNF